jgi:hypothetical protein
MRETTARIGSLGYAVNQQTGNSEWATPEDRYDQIVKKFKINPIIDVCATAQNTKCPKYITPEQDFFKTEIAEDAFMNPIYAKEQKSKGIRGVGNFVARLYHQHITHNINTVSLLSATVGSSPWFHTYYGEMLENQFGERSEILWFKKRIKFIGNAYGSPPFASIALLHRRTTEDKLESIRKRYEETEDKLLW